MIMKCVVCKKGEIEQAFTTITLEKNERPIKDRVGHCFITGSLDS
jgi:hypothetical protein